MKKPGLLVLVLPLAALACALSGPAAQQQAQVVAVGPTLVVTALPTLAPGSRIATKSDRIPKRAGSSLPEKVVRHGR